MTEERASDEDKELYALNDVRPSRKRMRRREGLGHRITAARVKRGLIQQELADLAGVGRAFLDSVENNRRAMPNCVQLDKIAKALDTTVDQLLHGPDDEATPVAVMVPAAIAGRIRALAAFPPEIVSDRLDGLLAVLRRQQAPPGA